MSDFNIQQVKAKLDQDLKDATVKSEALQKNTDSFLDTVKDLKTVDPEDVFPEKEETEFLTQIETDLDNSLNDAVLDLAGKEKDEVHETSK